MKSGRPLIMVTGKSGQIGYELARSLSVLGNVLPVDMGDFNYLYSDKIVKYIRENSPDIVVNTAAYTSVDTAEINRDTAMQINCAAPAIIAEELKRTGGLLVHFSTDYAYDGTKKFPYVETDPVNPLSIYALSKLEGDKAVAESGSRHLIFRTGWLYGSRGKNFLLTFLELCKNHKELSIINDQFGAPTWSRSVADAVTLILAQQKAYDISYSGLYHMTCSGEATWYEFAVKIAKYYEYKTGRRITIFPVSTGEYPMKAPRPKYSVLDNRKLQETFNVTLPEWTVPVRYVMEDMGYPEPAVYRFNPPRA